MDELLEFWFQNEQLWFNCSIEDDLLFTDQYPTIWKISLNKENKNVLIAYIESIFLKKKNEYATSNKFCG